MASRNETDPSDDYGGLGALAQGGSGVVSQLGLIGGGVLLTTALVHGLRSFDGSDHLYGQLGRALGDPMSYARDVLRSGREALASGEVTAGDAARTAILNSGIGETGNTAADRLKAYSRRIASTTALTARATDQLVRMREAHVLADAQASAADAATKASKAYNRALNLAREASQAPRGLGLFKEALDNPMSQTWFQATKGGFSPVKSPIRLTPSEVMGTTAIRRGQGSNASVERFGPAFERLEQIASTGFDARPNQLGENVERAISDHAYAALQEHKRVQRHGQANSRSGRRKARAERRAFLKAERQEYDEMGVRGPLSEPWAARPTPFDARYTSRIRALLDRAAGFDDKGQFLVEDALSRAEGEELLGGLYGNLSVTTRRGSEHHRRLFSLVPELAMREDYGPNVRKLYGGLHAVDPADLLADRGGHRRLSRFYEAVEGALSTAEVEGGDVMRGAAERAWRRFSRESPNRGLGVFGDVGLQQVLSRARTETRLAKLLEEELTGAVPPHERAREQATTLLDGSRPVRLVPGASTNHFSVSDLLPSPGAIRQLLPKAYAGVDVQSLMGRDVYGGLVTELRDRFQDMADDLATRQGVTFAFDIEENVRVDDLYSVTRIKLNQTTADGRRLAEEVIDLPEFTGLFNYMRDPGGRAFSAGLTATQDPYLAAYTGRPLQRPDELVMVDLLERSSKMLNDLKDGRGIAAVRRQINDVYKSRFRSHSTEDGSPGDLLNKGLLVRQGVMGKFGEVKDNRQRLAQFSGDLEHVSRMRRMVKSGSRYLSLDAEFWSEAISKGRGSQHVQAARGELPYQVSATVMQADGSGAGTSRVSVEYKKAMFAGEVSEARRAQLFSDIHRYADKAYDPTDFFDKVLYDVYQFQSGHAPDSRVLDDLFGKLHQGEMYLTEWGADGEVVGRADLKGGRFRVGGRTSGALAFLDDARVRPGQSIDAFFYQTLDALSRDQDVSYSHGHNITGADLPLLRAQYAAHGMEVPDLFTDARAVDTYNISRGLTMERGSSNSLSNVVARLYGIGQNEFELAITTAQDRVLTDRYGPTGRRFPKMTEAGESMSQKLERIMRRLGTTTLHSADVDTLLAGEVASELLYKEADKASTQVRLHTGYEIVQAANEAAGATRFASRNYGHLFGWDEDDFSLNFGMVSQEESAMGSGAFLKNLMTPFHRLLNPTRQRYQDLKAKKLYGPQDPLSTGALRPVRAMGSWLAAAGESGGVHMLESRIYSGYSAHTDFWQNNLDGASLGRIGLTAYVPESMLETYESQSMISSAQARSLEGPRSAQGFSFEVDRDALAERSKGRAAEIAAEYEGQLAFERGGPVATGHADRHKLYREMAMLESLRDTEATKAGRIGAQRGIEEIHRELTEDVGGQDGSRHEVYRRLQAEVEGHVWKPDIHESNELFDANLDKTTDVGRSSLPLFRGSAVVTGRNVKAPRVDLAAPLTMRIDEDGNARIVYVTDPGDVGKTTTGASRSTKATPHTVDRWLFGGKVTEEALPGTGIQTVAGAMFLKAKREEFGNLLMVQIQRVQRVATEQLQIAQARSKQMGGEYYRRAKEAILKDAAGAFEALGVQRHHARGVLKVVSYGGDDFVRLDFTDGFMRQAEEGASTLRFLEMNKRAGLTVAEVFASTTMQIERAHSMGALSAGAKDRLLGDLPDRMRRQIESVAKEIETELAQGKHSLDARKQLRQTADRLRGAAADVRASREGALFDMVPGTHRGEESEVLPGFVTFDTTQLIQHSSTQHTTMAQIFSGDSGRVTRQKRMSMMDAALFGRAFEEHAFGGSTAMGVLGRAYLNAASGATVVSSAHVEQALRDEIETLKSRGTLPANASTADLIAAVKPAGDGSFALVWEGRRVKLEANVYALQGSHTKARNAMWSMVTGDLEMTRVGGTTIGADGRIVEVDLTKAPTPGNPIEAILHGMSERDRAAAGLFLHQGIDVTTDPDAAHLLKQTSDTSTIYVGDGPGMISDPGSHPLLRRDRDYARIKMFDAPVGPDGKGASRSALELALREAGVSNDRIRLLLGDAELVEKALLSNFEGVDVDPDRAIDLGDPAARRLRRSVSAVRARAGVSGDRVVGSFLLPTLGDSLHWLPEGDLQKSHLPPVFRQMMDAVEKAQGVGAALGDVLRLAMSDPKAARSKVDELLNDPKQRNALEELRNLEAHVVKSIGMLMMQEQETITGRYLTGQYKQSGLGAAHHHKLSRLADLFDDRGRLTDDVGFRGQVSNMLRTHKTHMADLNPGLFATHLDAAADGLRKYVGGQVAAHGREVWRWQGFGLGESLVSDKVATKVHKTNASYLELVRKGKVSIDEGLRAELSKMGGDWLSVGAMEAEVAEIHRAIQRPGKGTISMVTLRQPDFQNLMPLHATQATVLSEMAMRAIGIDPDQIHTSDPIQAAIAREDFDGDIRFRGAFSNPAMNAAFRQTLGRSAPTQLKAFFDHWDGDLAGLGLQGVETVGDRVLMRPTTGGHLFEGGFAQAFSGAFGFSGQALGARASKGRSAMREALSLQKDVVGAFGSFQKRSVMRAQFHSAFGEMARQMGDDPSGFTPEEVFAVDRALARMDGLNATVKTDLGGPLQMLASAEAWITQEGAIEKHKTGDATTGSMKAIDMLGGFYGKRGDAGLRRSLDAVFSADALTGAHLGKHYWKTMGVDPSMDRAQAEAFLASGDERIGQLREMLTAGYEQQRLVRDIERRTSRPSSYVEAYTHGRQADDMLAVDGNGFSDVTRQGVTMAQQSVSGPAFSPGVRGAAALAAEVADRLSIETHEGLGAYSAEPGRIARMLTGLPSGGKLGLALGAVGALGALTMRDNRVADREAPPNRSHSKHATRRALASRERAERELRWAGASGLEVRRGFRVPPPPTAYGSY